MRVSARIAAVITALAVVAVPASAGASAPPPRDDDRSSSPDGTHVVFDRTDTSTDQSLGIFETTPTSSATAVRLTTGRDAYPTLSPDGTHIAFARLVNDTTQAIFTA